MNRTRFSVVTTVVLLGVTFGLIAYDFLAFYAGGVDTTISRISIRMMTEHPVIALAAGGLVGHLTWSNKRPTDRKMEAILLGFSLAILVAMDLFHVLPAMTPLWPFLIGIPVGHVLWGQNLSPAERAARAIQTRA